MEETAVLLTQAQAGDRGAREILVEKNLGLVHHIVKRFLGRGYEAEDLFQIGSIGLMKAIDKFDLTYEVKFSTYAVPMIAGEIKRFLRDDGMVKVSRTLKENGMKIKQAADEVSKELGREATISEISELTGISVEDIVVAMEANAAVSSRLVTPTVMPPRAVAGFRSVSVRVVIPKFSAYSTPSCGDTVSIIQRTATIFME